MNEEFKKFFGWIPDLLKQPLTDYFKKNSAEYEIMVAFKDGWENHDTIGNLKKLTEKYGDKAGQTVEKYLELNILRDWAGIGKKEAHPGTEMEDFFRVLWGPNTPEKGFEFTIKREKRTAVFRVTKCPLYDLAEKTGLQDWLYHLACATDFFTTAAFSSKLGFTRTKTLIQGHDCCDHTYFYK
jgi:hypothetical protein